MRYPIKLTVDGPYFLVTFPDFPEAITHGESEEDALRHALDALETVFWHSFDSRDFIPEPSTVKRGQRFVDVPLTAAKVLLHNEMLRQKVRPAALARRMGLPRKKLDRILNPRYKTRIDTTAKVFTALGKHLKPYIA
jgi:antitoxin HicB